MATIDGIVVADVLKTERCGAHSHINGLGVNDELVAQRICNGMVAQEDARQAAALIVRMAKTRCIAGRAVLMTGRPGSGKTAIAHAMSQELGTDTPFVSLSASEVFRYDRPAGQAEGDGGRRGERGQGERRRQAARPRLRPRQGLRRAGCARQARQVSRRRDPAATQDDAHGVPARHRRHQQPHKRVQYVWAVHPMPIALLAAALFSGDTGEIKQEVRHTIDKKVGEWREEGKADIVVGLLFIDEVHMLDMHCFSFLNRATEEALAPLVVMATNRSHCVVRGTDWRTAHGIPTDLLDRCLIIRTAAYTDDDVADILAMRAKEENIEIEPTAIAILTKVLCKRNKASVVSAAHLKKAFNLFHDEKRSSALMESYQQHMVGGE